MTRVRDKQMTNINGFVYMLGALNPLERVPLVVLRDDKEITLQIVPRLKD